MGKLVNGINGPFVGKVGNVIGSSWRGIPYMKSTFVVYAAFISADRESQSDSVYLGTFTRNKGEKPKKEDTPENKTAGENKTTAENNDVNTEKEAAPVLAKDKTADRDKPAHASAAATIAVTENPDAVPFVPSNQLNLFELPDETIDNKAVALNSETSSAELPASSAEPQSGDDNALALSCCGFSLSTNTNGSG